MNDVPLPDLVEIEPTDTCNLRCRMCHVSFEPQHRPTYLDVDLLESLAPLKGRHAIIAATYEPMVHPRFVDLVRKLTEFQFRIELITNGTQLQGDSARALEDSDLLLMNFSFDGIARDTYEYIRRGASCDATLTNVANFRSRLARRETYFAVNSTTLRRNLEETEAIIDYWNGQDFDMVRFIIMVVRDLTPDLITESLYPVRDEAVKVFDRAARHIIQNRLRIAMRSPFLWQAAAANEYPSHVIRGLVHSDNPRTRIPPTVRQEFQLGHYPGMTFPCRSPFTAARVLPNGDVQLCYQFTIGNLHEHTFTDIWYGDRANAIRTHIQQNIDVCRTCEYYRLCLRSREVDVNSQENYFAAHLFPAVKSVDFDRGDVLTELRRAAPPRLIDTLEGHNIVFYNRKYVVVPHATGTVDLASVNYQELEGVVECDTLQEARVAIAARTAIHPDAEPPGRTTFS